MMRNVAVVVEDQGDSPSLLGLYHGVPLTQRTQHYAGVLPDRISIYRRPLVEEFGTALLTHARPSRARRSSARPRRSCTPTVEAGRSVTAAISSIDSSLKYRRTMTLR